MRTIRCSHVLMHQDSRYQLVQMVCLSPGHIVLDGDPCSCPAASPNGWMDQDATWYRGRPRPWPHSVGWGPSPPKVNRLAPTFSPCLLWPNGWTNQDATWYRGRPRPRRHCVRWEPSFPQRGTHPNFGPRLLWPLAKWLDESR